VRRYVEVQLHLRLQAGEKHEGEVTCTQGREERVIVSSRKNFRRLVGVFVDRQTASLQAAELEAAEPNERE